MSYFGFNFMFTLVPIMVMIIFCIVFGTIIVRAIKGTKEWTKNNNSPVLTVEAEVVAKRMAVRGSHHHNGAGVAHSSAYTTYFVTFEVTSGDRIEFIVPDKEYGILVEGDIGQLTFQGTRYQGFVRDK